MPVIYMARYLPFLRYRACYLYGTVPAMKRYCACYLLGQYLQFLRYRAHSVYGTVPCPFCIRHSTCNFCGTVPILYTARYLQFLRYRAHSVYGTVPPIFAVPCLLFIRDGTCHEAVLCLLFIGTVPAIFAVPCPLFIRDGTCHLSGTVPVIYVGWYLPFLRYRAHYLCGMVPAIFAVPCP